MTGDAVAMEIRVARPASRALALLVDLFAQVLLWLTLQLLGVFVLLLLASLGLAEWPLWQAMAIVITVVVFVGYPTAMLTLTRGRTLGKLALGLRVVRDDGGPVGFRHSFTRTLVGVAVEFPAVVLPFGGWILSVLLMTTHPRSKRLGDHAAGTFVIHERTPPTGQWLPAMPPRMAIWAATLDLSRVDDELALTVRHFLGRTRSLAEPARSRLGEQLAREIAQATSPPPPAGTAGWEYLAAVHAERHDRAMRRVRGVPGAGHPVWSELLAVTAPPRPPSPTSPNPAGQAPAAR
ncbi:RDD family protein [Natronosporangium hydrolyticum]|uniref:RDD family protein n=1 Tax=Natronosporangium hydrolyticum TaxID=2811111 RepID=A0A895YDS9_9ACTN|nr:RDD family protein [Natronosporangium hydrolyticum]QSB15964.1 RDD family protein [Natronosporangium hydrolyticum]